MVTAFVADLITPFIAAIFGKPAFGGPELQGGTAPRSSTARSSTPCWSFLIVATVVFFAVVVPLTAPMRAADPAAQRGAQARDRQCPECLSDIPVGGAPVRLLHVEVGAAA